MDVEAHNATTAMLREGAVWRNSRPWRLLASKARDNSRVPVRWTRTGDCRVWFHVAIGCNPPAFVMRRRCRYFSGGRGTRRRDSALLRNLIALRKSSTSHLCGFVRALRAGSRAGFAYLRELPPETSAQNGSPAQRLLVLTNFYGEPDRGLRFRLSLLFVRSRAGV